MIPFKGVLDFVAHISQKLIWFSIGSFSIFKFFEAVHRKIHKDTEIFFQQDFNRLNTQTNSTKILMLKVCALCILVILVSRNNYWFFIWF
jgi:hypothetical protein